MSWQPESPQERERERSVYDWAPAPERSPLVRTNFDSVPQTRKRRRRKLKIAASFCLIFAIVVAALSPVSGPAGGTLKPWDIEITSTGNQPVTALVFGTDAGWRLVRIPAASGGQSNPRKLTARLGKGDLHIIALGWSPLNAHGVSPPGAPEMKWTARSHVFTAYQREESAGVRALW